MVSTLKALKTSYRHYRQWEGLLAFFGAKGRRSLSAGFQRSSATYGDMGHRGVRGTGKEIRGDGGEGINQDFDNVDVTTVV